MSSLCSKIENGGSRHGIVCGLDVKPTVTWKGQQMYKSIVVSGYVGNPQFSKDMLTKVKETFYVDKAKSREGVPTMTMQIGSDCGVFF